ncbi:MAG TPA: methyl coenzyme M reductase system, component A2 [Methanocorpusculum sp.]|nr:methyl coenzyme M reductase system, component A2 [Candidatus Methanocorpusculum equi]MCQ2357554.1 methyl coenzyme M reductase system, component A2 [Methanocorpusculum sp.]HJJ32894.1 methyl coenzyme M reductase system, component A2 [Methanocorpusculum sp.]HJJ44778.1 methyl coenzyme M reductase system, component A2 [Methanocorpusculum sp.]HJJ58696.1 methyl coenzyme M reductase system, component A2 [Methanocorpusculum sp.]
MTNPFISIQNLCMDFPESGEDTGEKQPMVRVLDNINLEIAEGEIVGVIGRSGCGKSVFIHLLRGIDNAPTEGKIIYHVSRCKKCGRIEYQSMAGQKCPSCGGTMEKLDVDFWNPENEELKEAIMQRTSLMFQRTFALYGDDRVIDNVLRALEDVNYPSDKAINRAIDLLEEVRLGHRLTHVARDLSGGEKQRVVLARQLAREPFFLCADEPTGTLDTKTAQIVHGLLKQAAKNLHMGMVITSHFSQVLEEACDRAVLLDDGKIVKIGSPEEIVAEFMKNCTDDTIYTAQELGGPIVRAKDVRKKFIAVDRGVINAVNGVTFEINEREVFGVIGVSGGGKTTLSRMIAGIYEPTSGNLDVRVGDEWVDMRKPGFENRGRAKQYIGLLHQEYDLYPHRTIIDNLTDAIGLEFPKELAVRKAMITLKMAGFTEKKAHDVLNRYPPSLSEGEKHRVALAQILIREPRIILLDEPTGTMDPITKVDVKHSILHAREEMDETFIIVSHDMEFIRDVCDRCMFMRDGEIVAIGETQSVLKNLSEAELITMHEAVTRERERVESGTAKKATLSGGAPEGEVDENAIHKTTDEMFEM